MTRNRARGSHPFKGVVIKRGLEEIRWSYPDSKFGGETYVVDGSEFIGDITKALPARNSYKYPNRVNHEGLYVSCHTGQQVWYESMTEYIALMQIEHEMEVASIASQPCCFLFRGGYAHYPDYALKTCGGATTVVDVRDLEWTDESDIEKFNRTASICDRLGWGYRIIEPMYGYRLHNLVWLAGYRHGYVAPGPELKQAVLEAAAEPLALMELACILSPDPEWLYLPQIYHLMFHRYLGYDDELPFHDETRVWKI
ncbi:TnsA-like heteromeric transposase endonuclease subunit [Paeniglutamicibacter kerguelensis]|uniref:TnsA-like heteromeric transposase endonuclease subunit n=1 Tax=Paeniglutamicibacter kerguelensis TaxID=254788 RepID=A0ABS4XCZ1_9MICC|nr:TnsA-like heteromeric transposase endonuclease subunit [Paeniglutamicibacter kerguelensis]MBP2386342.1 hypothetical protein [Paeniglutamicibacter kerguelensis]